MERIITATFLIVLSISLLSSVTSKNLLPPRSNSSTDSASFLTEQVPTNLNVSDERLTQAPVGPEIEQLGVSAKSQKLEITTASAVATNEPSNANVDIERSEEINSFGIRSFTAEVSARTQATPKTTELLSTEKPGPTAADVASPTPTPVETSTSTKPPPLPSRDENPKSRVNTPRNDGESPSGGEPVESAVKIEKTFDNGLVRIKIGEITTDEFSNLLNFDELEDERNALKLPSEVSLHHEQPKMNINDFFASKNEDFTRTTAVKKTKPVDNRSEGTSANTPTSIEIELIEDTTSSTSPEKPSKVATKSDFIPRRSKKSEIPSDQKANKKPDSKDTEKVHDFAMTKFTSEGSNGTKQAASPEFSTTKFYNNNKDLYQDILHKVKKPAAPSLAKTTLKVAPKLPDTKKASAEAPKIPTFPAETASTKHHVSLSTNYPRIVTRLEDKLNALDCDVQNLSADSTIWRGNETHQIFLPSTTPEDCSSKPDCLPLVLSWEASGDIQSGDVLLVEIDDKFLISSQQKNLSDEKVIHHNNAAVYQVTRLGHENCDITEGELLDITPLIVDGKKLVTLYDKDLTEGINLLIVVSEKWDQQCVRLRVNVKSDNCGENAECSGKGICFSNTSMEGYECECCTGFSGPHCEEIDACTPSPCTNNGICVDLSQGHDGNSYQCLCPYGYTGKNCETEVDPCSASQCLNGGTCVTNTTHFRCECKQGYTGPLCQHNLNECESSPCVHGICVDQEDGFRCFCQPGFSGDLCNFEYNECDSNPCVNGGQCVDHVGGYICQCTKGYQGKRCHIKIDFCASNPCEDGYRCVDYGDEYSCVCPGSTDHNVPDCKEVPRLLCPTNPCANGGTCWTSAESFYCACRPGFIGKLCEDDFNIETVVSSSELLSDISYSNVISFDDQHENMQDVESFDLHSAFVAAGVSALVLVVLASLAALIHFKGNISYRRFSVLQRQLFPYFNRESKNGGQSDYSNHWLSGKNSSFFEENHINLKSNQQPRHEKCVSRSILNQPNEMNVETDRYFSKDYSESIRSPLIQ